ncbi:MAG: PepSY domain-containing protein, partial [Gammaproteobacteria bacterium]|nr:PepSY domain-containing protein [Gammaproteobacteria bacterium]
ASAASPFVAVQDSDDEREPGPANLQEAAEIAVKRYGGRAIGAETVVHEGRTVHEIRLYNDEGSARTVRVDPATGAILE